MQCDIIYWMLIIMLIVLTLISAVGGGIRPRENFLAEISDINGELHEDSENLAPAEFLSAVPLDGSSAEKDGEKQILQPEKIQNEILPTESTTPTAKDTEKKVHFEKPNEPAPAPSEAHTTGYSVQPFDDSMMMFMPLNKK